MKLSARDAAAFLARPGADKAGILIYGGDAMRVALKRQELIANLIGPAGEAEMRLTRMAGADLQSDPAKLDDAVKAASFFPGRRCAFVEDARDSHTGAIAAALTDWAEGDAMIVVTAGSLRAASALRKAFEGASNAYALAVYDDPPSRAEIGVEMARAGLAEPGRDAMEALVALSRSHDPGEFRQILEKVTLYKLGDAAALSAAEVEACAPTSAEAGLDDVIRAAADGRSDRIGPLVRRLAGQGVQPVGLCIAALRHFRMLHAAAADPGGAAAGVGRLRPPVFGPRREQMLRQVQAWGVARLEQAISVLVDTDLALRSSQKAPQFALVERSLIRLAMLGAR